MDRAEHRPAGVEEGDQRPEERAAGDEGLGAVDRVEDPDELGVGPVGAVLLAEDAVVREAPADRLAKERFGLAVGDRDRRLVRLELDVEVVAREVGPDEGAALLGELDNEVLERLPVRRAAHSHSIVPGGFEVMS